MDFHVNNCGSIVILNATTVAGIEWAQGHLPEDALRWGNGYVIEPRYLGDILDGILEDGLEWM